MKKNALLKLLLICVGILIIYPSLFNSYDAFVIFKTGCISGNRKIVIEAEIPGFTQKYKQSFNLDSSYKAIYIKPAALTGDLNLSSAKDAQINISIFESDGTTLIDSKTFPVTIKSRNDVEWTSDEFGQATQDNILCFLTPESDAITELKRAAIDEFQVAVDVWRGKGEYFLIETTAVADSQNSREIFVKGANELIGGDKPSGSISYLTASEWAYYLQNTVEYIVDCDDSRVLGLTPFAN